MRIPAFCSLLLLVPAVSARAEVPIDFNRDIRPILSAHCFACHGPDANHRQAGLRLDERDAALAAVESGAKAIVPGDLAASELWQRVSTNDEALVMPPPAAKKPLTDQQRELLRRWIAEGAPYAAHWSFVPPKKAELPEVKQADWPQQPLDRFVLARLEAEGLAPAKPANPHQLIRRLSLDLTGLPPSPEEVTAFVQDTDPQRVEKLVNRLLESPHFGERMALDWLDAARYADTNGFSIDGGRHQWLWRDWVIQAFNDNLPYDRFLVDQLAGDLLPDATIAQKIASGFQRNNMVTHEGGTIPEENLTNYNADRVKTLGEAVLGLTLGCAQCHDHKYDPISQKDYYQLFAYFNTVSDIGLDGNFGVNPRPYMQTPTILKTSEVERLPGELATVEEQLNSPDPAQVEAWVAKQRESLTNRGQDFALHPVELMKVSTPNRGGGFDIETIDDKQLVHITQPSALIAYDVLLKLPSSPQKINGFRVVFHPDPATPEGGTGFGKPPADLAEKPTGETGTFRLTAFSASADASPADQVNLHRLARVASVTASSWDSAHRPERCLDPRNENGWSPSANTTGPVHLTVTFAEPIDTHETPFATVQLNFGFGQNLVAARMEIQAFTGTDDGSELPEAVAAIVSKEAAERTPEETALLHDYYRDHSQATERLRVQKQNLQERLAVLTQPFTTMVMDVAEKPRATHILHRGDYTQPRDVVTVGTPSVFPGLSDTSPDRTGLARWVTMPDHPLTSRVAVNRVWQMLFGRGLVATPADFGSQGELPSHPELLDWLAVDFVESGWDVKRLIQSIVLSATYQQDSAATAALLERDPANVLLARGPRFRLSAELIRDQALAVSGLLVPRIGGPSVNPYAPGDLWREISHYGSTPATAQTFVQDHGEKLYRRSLYTFWKRTAPPPNMAAFDAPNRETCVVSRPVTNTPLQALVLLNDVQFVEATRAFAERMLHQPGDDQSRIEWGILAALSRPAAPDEIAVLKRALARERAFYTAHPEAAAAYLANGESPRDEQIAPTEHAAWSQVAALLLNLSETVTRE
jgi:hypothetical protein